MRPLSLVLPCYNEGKSLPALVSRVLQCAHRRGLSPEGFELLLVNNGSTDDTAQVLATMCREPGHEFWRVVDVPVNRGYGYGLIQGLRAARPGVVAWSHADEQCDPEDCFRGWEQMSDGTTGLFIKGRRKGRSFGSWLFSRGFDAVALFILGRRLHEINAQPKVFDGSLIGHLDAPPDGFAFDLYVLLKARENGYRFREIEVLFLSRKHGQSRWASTFRSKWKTIRGLVAFMVGYRFGKPYRSLEDRLPRR